MTERIDKNTYNSLDFLPEGHFIVDKEFKVLYWNKSLETMTNVTRDEILNQKLDSIFPNFGQPIYRKRIEPIFVGGPPVIFSGKLHKNLFVRDSNNEGYFFRVTISSLPLAEKKFNALFSIEDRSEIYSQIDELVSIKERVLNEISEKELIHKKLLNQHKEIEEAFLALSDKSLEIESQRQKLQELNATKDKFFSILAHDLINPFNAMMGLSELMNKQAKAESNQELKLYIELLGQTIKQTYSLLENLLEWSRTQSGHIQFQPKTVVLKQVVIDIIELNNLKFKEKEISTEIQIDNNLLVTVDPNMLSTILRNLVSNAIKFTPQHGKVIFKANSFSEPNESEVELIQVSVCDTGMGINAENQKKLFKIEENFTTFGTNHEKGTGLGLILCKEFVEINGGEIWVESEEGKGTCFHFTIPKT